ncbi:MAG TPA: BON domain-containing protein [Anaeromyxobacter sp.]|nr:BON domain-containing protein [Anaeromyxobacter sp.]
MGRRGEWRDEEWHTGGRSAADERREVMEGGDEGWPGGVRGSEGGAGYGRGFFGTAYGLYTGRPEHEPSTRSHERWGRERREERGLGERRVRGRGPKGYHRSDERILDEIVERLMWAGINAADVEIKVENGEVTLSGTVADRSDKRNIEDACEDVMGVADVHNEIRVSRRDLEGGTPGVH